MTFRGDGYHVRFVRDTCEAEGEPCTRPNAYIVFVFLDTGPIEPLPFYIARDFSVPGLIAKLRELQLTQEDFSCRCWDRITW